MERISNGQSTENNIMIPDGVFIITNIESEKSLLFFLEVDMGTETLVNSRANLLMCGKKLSAIKPSSAPVSARGMKKSSTLYIIFKENSPSIGRVLPPGQAFPSFRS